MTSNPTDMIERCRSESQKLFPQRMRDGHSYHSTAYILDQAANTLTQQESEIEALRELLGRIAPFIGWASTRSQIIAGVEANEALCDEIDAALSTTTDAPIEGKS